MFTAKQLRNCWIKFFADRGFLDLSDRSLIPSDSDKSLLFVNSGVAAIKSYFCGDLNLPSRKIVSAQRVVRTGDIDDIGRSFRHHTYFEMLGNFNIGNADRSEAIDMAWEFLTSVLKLPEDKFYVTVFNEDEESFLAWSKHLSKSRIIVGGKKTNFWDMGVGPCGPCTEIYFDRGEEYDPHGIGIDLLLKNQENERYLEIWNLVFSDFINLDGKITLSPFRNLDTGAGMERLLMILQNKRSSFETTLFSPIVDYLIERFNFSSKEYLWASADYFRTSCVLLRDGIFFGNKGRDYVLRKLFRRACEFLGEKKLDYLFFENLCAVITKTLEYYDWDVFFKKIVNSMWQEYSLMFLNLEASKNLLEKLFENYVSEIPAEEVFNLVSSHGVSFDYLSEEIENNGRFFSVHEYDRLFKEHRVKSLNKNISSAFAKQIPVLLQKASSTEFDYEKNILKSKIIDKYSGDDFHRDIKDSDSDIYVVLDRTSIFPLSAGQASDLGWITFHEKGCKPHRFKIDSSIKAMNGQILHKMENVNDFVRNRIKSFSDCIVEHDVDRRKKTSANHTAEHLLFATLKKIIHKDVKRVSGYKDSEGFSIEISVPNDFLEISFDLLSINKELNEAIKQSIPVEISWGNLERARKMGILGKFDEIYEMNKDNLRFVSLGKYGSELCIGTHVNNTREIEIALIVKFSKSKKNSYKFYAVTGINRVEEVLAGMNIENYLLNIKNKDQINRDKRIQKKQSLGVEKKKLMDALVGSQKIAILEKKVDVNVAMSAFKEIRSHLQNQLVVLFFQDDGGFRFFISSQGINIFALWNFFREQGAKCGGNDSFGSGWFPGLNFEKIMYDSLRKTIHDEVILSELEKKRQELSKPYSVKVGN